MTPNETYSFLDSCRLLPPQIYFWKPFTKATIYIDTAQRSLLYHVDLYDMTISIFAGDQRLPQTGETDQQHMTLSGLLLLAMSSLLGLFGMTKRQRKE